MKNKSKRQKKIADSFDRFSTAVTEIAGRPLAFSLALIIIIMWAIAGPVCHFSDTWQLVINTLTTLVTFLMVFVIQQSQNKDSMATQLKLNELIAANKLSSNRLIDAEGLTEDELKILKEFYVRLSAKEKEENNLHSSHSIEELDDNKLKEATPGKEEKKQDPNEKI